MRWSVEPVDVAETRHLALVPLDDEAAAVESWPVAPMPLCGNQAAEAAETIWLALRGGPFDDSPAPRTQEDRSAWH